MCPCACYALTFQDKAPSWPGKSQLLLPTAPIPQLTSTICCFTGCSYHTTSPPAAWHACLASISVAFTSLTSQQCTEVLSQKKVALKRGAPAQGQQQCQYGCLSMMPTEAQA